MGDLWEKSASKLTEIPHPIIYNYVFVWVICIVIGRDSYCWAPWLWRMRRLNPVRNRKQALRVVKELDAFPKVPESYKETSASGGGRKYCGKIVMDPIYYVTYIYGSIWNASSNHLAMCFSS